MRIALFADMHFPRRGDRPADARAALSDGTRTLPQAASVPAQASPELGSLDSSLFERITRSYRRHTPSLKAYDESKTARDVRLTEQPAFFKDL